MTEGELEIEIKIDNIEEFIRALKEFNPMMKNELYNSLLRTANKEEKILKSTQGFTDRTGKLRRSLFVTATFNPLGIEGGSHDPKAVYVAYPHGTWLGNWWEKYKREATPIIFKVIEKAVNRIVNKWNKR